MENLTLESFVEKFKEIKNRGWIKTHRSGNTGIGKTLEDLLGVTENNIQGPDYGIYELKSKRLEAKSMLTLMTKSPEPAKSNSRLLEKFGYSSDAYDNDEKVLHSTLNSSTFTPISNTGKFLKVVVKDEKIMLESKEGIEEPYWNISVLKEKIEAKLGGQFVFVRAQSRGKGTDEEFLFESAYLLSGVSSDKIIDLIRDGKLYVDLRMGQYPDGRIHDHGTGFRIKEKDEHLVYEKNEKLV